MLIEVFTWGKETGIEKKFSAQLIISRGFKDRWQNAEAYGWPHLSH